MKIETPYLFGYGTIRSDLGNYSHPPRNATSIGFGRTVGELWQIRNCFGTWAGVKEISADKMDHDSLTVYGEVFQVQSLDGWKMLDRREQVYARPPMYIRKLVDVRMESKDLGWYLLKAYIYFAGVKASEFLTLVPSGDWCDLLEDRVPTARSNS